MISTTKAPITQTAPQLSLRVACAAKRGQGDGEALLKEDRSFITNQYATYPFRLSNNLSLDPTDAQRVYAYVMNAGPGMLAGDDLRVVVEVCDRARLYLSDQSATKVHSMSPGSPLAHLTYDLEIGNQACLEFVPEPIILFSAAALKQRTQVTLHPQGQLMLSEIVVPGRLARGEFYQFQQFENRLQVKTTEGKLCFVDNQKLIGRANRFRTHSFLTDYPVLGSFVAIFPQQDHATMPNLTLTQLSNAIDTYDAPDNELQIGESPLPNCNGLLIRSMATQVSVLKAFHRYVLSTVRSLLNEPLLPDIPK